MPCDLPLAPAEMMFHFVVWAASSFLYSLWAFLVIATGMLVYKGLFKQQSYLALCSHIQTLKMKPFLYKVKNYIFSYCSHYNLKWKAIRIKYVLILSRVGN